MLHCNFFIIMLKENPEDQPGNAPSSDRNVESSQLFHCRVVSSLRAGVIAFHGIQLLAPTRLLRDLPQHPAAIFLLPSGVAHSRSVNSPALVVVAAAVAGVAVVHIAPPLPVYLPSWILVLASTSSSVEALKLWRLELRNGWGREHKVCAEVGRRKDWS
ncbi:hypothetical protein AAHA92_05909 [Salvia divinorum]|uniref:Uncharacterized protein n=1 Tax=Salvia divinorum TaxID=28513 RepID=A0ABD1I3Y0_SALDI